MGVYTANGKIASIGIRAQGWVVRHGFALNVDCDLSAFRQFQACGLDVPFTSVANELGRPFTVADAREPVLRRLGEVLGSTCPRCRWRRPRDADAAASPCSRRTSRRAARFYGEQLGLTVEEDEDGFWARESGVELRVEGGARKRRLSREFYEEAGVLVRLETDDVRRASSEASSAGASSSSARSRTPTTGRFAGFVDPDGNLFELIETGG